MIWPEVPDSSCFAGASSLNNPRSIVRDMPCIAWFNAQMKKGGGESGTAKQLARQLDRFRAKHAAQVQEGPGQDIERQCDLMPSKLVDIIDPAVDVSQGGLSRLAAATVHASFLAEATEAQIALDNARQHSKCTKCITIIPAVKGLRIADDDHRGAMRDALMIEGEIPPGMKCHACGKGMTKQHAMTCMKAGAQTRIHNVLRDTFAKLSHFAHARRVIIEPRDHPNGTGPDLELYPVPVHRSGQCPTVRIDFTVPTAMADSNLSLHARKSRAQGAVAAAHERAKENGTLNEYGQVAKQQGEDFCGAAIEKDTLHFGPRLEELIERLASLKKGQIIEDDVHQEFGYRAGMWHVPSAVSHFKAMLAVAVIRKNAALVREHCVRSAQHMDRA